MLNLEIKDELQFLNIYDQFGKLVMELTDGSIVVNISHLPVGIYYVRIVSENGIGVQKFVKN
ncbi:MAG: T9SS type A sorting domain-containing protein [Crocinitomix sp.]|nr:T9SS type A sorting domain-containing protein [Crocinitomix sp.]